MKRWKLQDAKTKLSELVREAKAGEPQIISVRNGDAVVVVAVDVYEEMRAPSQNAWDALRPQNFKGVDWDMPDKESVEFDEVDF